MQKVDNKKDNEEKDFAHVVISWLITINLNPFGKHCKIRKNSN